MIHLLAIKTLGRSSTHAVLILQNYAGIIEKQVPPLTSEDSTLTTPQDEPTNDGNNTESTEPTLAGTTTDNSPVSTLSHTINSVPAPSPGDQANTLPGTTRNNTQCKESTLAGTTTDNNTVSTASHSIDCAPASTLGNQTNTLSGTTGKNTLPSLLPGTTANEEPTSVDTSQETIEVIVGSIKSDPTTIDILLSEGSSNSGKIPALPEVPNVSKDEPDPVNVPTTSGYMLPSSIPHELVHVHIPEANSTIKDVRINQI